MCLQECVLGVRPRLHVAPVAVEEVLARVDETTGPGHGVRVERVRGHAAFSPDAAAGLRSRATQQYQKPATASWAGRSKASSASCLPVCGGSNLRMNGSGREQELQSSAFPHD